MGTQSYLDSLNEPKLLFPYFLSYMKAYVHWMWSGKFGGGTIVHSFDFKFLVLSAKVNFSWRLNFYCRVLYVTNDDI